MPEKATFLGLKVILDTKKERFKKKATIGAAPGFLLP
jgi:hypothetical protein